MYGIYGRPMSHPSPILGDLRALAAFSEPAAAETLNAVADVLEAALAALRVGEPILAACDSAGMSCGPELAQVRAALAEAAL
jgi:hypothetical protein